MALPCDISQRERGKNKKVNNETRGSGEVCQLQKEGCCTQLWAPSAHPNACLFPKRPNHGPSLQKNRRKK